ncbi:hypothetical protein HGRIS_000219 [Hohenbuehelia grisea]|uniref:Aldehyde dehydrogenase domain-containing protein n=1 Tax=Hohenbuehelia grisea TaxID=104357 RepID=A0ABR3JRY3_9AGAR
MGTVTGSWQQTQYTIFTPLIIAGQHRPASTQETFDIRNPYTRKVVGTSASASSQDCNDAITAAADAYKIWENSPLSLRREIFLRAAELAGSEKYKQKVIETAQQETAASAGFSTGTWASGPNLLRTTASLVNELKGDSFPSGSVPGAQVVSQRRAMGVVLAISPWNAPYVLTLRAVAVPILCGNTVVLKSSELSPRSQLVVVELFEEAGLPPGVLNFVSMSRETAPALTSEIIAHPAIRKINFTGSDRVGRILAGEAAKHLKPCVFELGGKAPFIVFEDANVQEAAKSIAFTAMLHSGQVCMSTERVVVHSNVADALVSEVKSLCASLKAGDPVTDSAAKLSALFSEDSAKNIVGMIHEAVDQGATLALGDLALSGAVLQPHLLTGVKPGMKIWERESFGPVVGFTTFETIDEAIELANATEYSLSAAMWTTNVHTARDVAPRIRAGYVNINGSTFHSEAYIGVAGLGGASGYGRFDVENFTDKRLIISHPPGRSYPEFF